MVDAREERAKSLAKDKRIKRVEGAMWFVPSQSQNAGGYLVNMLAASCTCPDHELRGKKCKHVIAVELTQVVETAADGQQVVTETVKVTRKTYGQDWPAYNAAQCAEKATAQVLLRALCDGILTPPQSGRGQRAIPLSDAVYGMAMKVYTTVSGRRATTDIRQCAAKGHMAKAPHYNSLFNYFEKPELTPLLTTLVEESASPLACVESQFAVDSTGFGTVTYRRWYDAKYGREMKEHGWLKAHAMVGTTTNVITAIRVTDCDANDGPELPALVASTDRRFKLAEVSADKAYLTHRNLDAIEAVHAVPYIPFKSNSKGDGPAAWRRMFGLFMYKQPEFLAHYHARSNVESTFSAIKRKFGGSVRSKNPTAQVNEVLCKALCFNLSCLVHAIHELGIEPSFPGLTS
jgi:transposase/predicted nucleic acid-binding Zn finger protein